ncbi:MAG TPA: carboxypeptidase regulatory-like domain-containing protein [Desulfotomaculum sp.]|nr:MAG: hypothetical protein JL56_04260 [Desulfotomaculum sp. BICA1-6]HBX24068.1 carboxypeptidase regulatory-like domain-containing protein [Desulfotomaculum sp.]
MLQQSMFKSGRITVIIMVALLCCFLFAGTALATTPGPGSLDVYPYGELEDISCTQEDNVDYTLHATDLNLDMCYFCDQELIVKFPVGSANKTFDLSPSVGESVIMEVLVTHEEFGEEGRWVIINTIPEVDPATGTVTFLPQCANFGLDGDGPPTNAIVEEVKIMKIFANNPCAQDNCYRVDMIFTGYPGFKVDECVELEQTVGSINVNNPEGLQYESCMDVCVPVDGRVFDCPGDGYEGIDVKVYLNDRYVTTTTTDEDGVFSACSIPCKGLEPGSHTVRVEATDDCGNSVEDTATFTVVNGEPVGVYIFADDDIFANECNEVTVQLVDRCGNPTEAVYRTKVEVLAWEGIPCTTVEAGKFYENCVDCPGPNPSGEINYFYFEPGEGNKTLYFLPSVMGDITMEARPYIPEREKYLNKDTDETTVFTIDGAIFELDDYLVKDQNLSPRAGWPIAVSIIPTYDGDERAANYDYEIRVVFCDVNGDTSRTQNNATWSIDNDLGPYFNCSGNGAIVERCDTKTHFYIYPDENLRGSYCVVAQLVNPVTDEVVAQSGPITLGNFVTPIELQRHLERDRWQLLSTPRYVAKEEAAGYANMAELLQDVEYSYIIAYDDNAGQWKVLDPASTIAQPLKAYFVKTKQDNPQGYDVNYVFARVTEPGSMVPPVRMLNRGWNSVGIAIDDKNMFDNWQTRQTDDVYNAFGSVYKGAKLIWNPGSYLSNLTKWTTATWIDYSTDNTYDVYNGDGYWVYLTDRQELTANIGQDLIDSPTYRPTP